MARITPEGPRRRENGKPGSRPKRMRKRGAPTYVAAVPLTVTPRDAHLVDQRLRLVGMLRNSLLQTALVQWDALVESDAWQAARAMPRTTDDERAARNGWFRPRASAYPSCGGTKLTCVR